MTTIAIDSLFTGLVYDAGLGNTVERTVLDNGVRIISETMPAQKSVSIGFWIGVGSRDEVEGGFGSTHFLEHLLFKGTTNYSAFEISESFDRVGGESNAWTAKESTCYHARIINTDLPMAVDVLADMVTSPLLDAQDMDLERGVILEELALDADDPGNVAHEELASLVLDQHPLGRPIGGTPEAIRAISQEQMLAHYKRYYQPEQLIITAAGGVSHQELVSLVTTALQRTGWLSDQDVAVGATVASPALPAPRRSGTPAWEPQTRSGQSFIPKHVEQSAVMLGGRSLNTQDPQRFALSVLNVILGGGTSSRLFQEIREKRGLAYSTYAFSAGYSDLGYYGLYAGCHPARTDDVLDLINEQFQLLAEHGVTEDELTRAQGQISGSLVLGLEDTGSRMSRLGRAELVTGEFTDLEGAVQRISSVTAEQVHQVAQRLGQSEQVRVVVGPEESSTGKV